MRVMIESVGGLAGRAVLVAQYDTEDLPPEEEAHVRAALEALPHHEAAPEIGADLPAYRITIDGGESYEIQGDPTVPPLAPLLR